MRSVSSFLMNDGGCLSDDKIFYATVADIMNTLYVSGEATLKSF